MILRLLAASFVALGLGLIVEEGHAAEPILCRDGRIVELDASSRAGRDPCKIARLEKAKPPQLVPQSVPLPVKRPARVAEAEFKGPTEAASTAAANGPFRQASADYRRVRIINARQAWQPVTDPFAPPVLKFLDAVVYHIDLSGNRDLVGKFKRLSIFLDDDQQAPRYKSKSASTRQLAESDNPKDLAEFQWRLTTPVTTLLLGILAVPLSRSSPRRGRFAKTVAAALVFALLYNFNVMAKNWVEQGVAGAIPGVWWPNVLLGLLILLLLLRPNLGMGGK